MQLLNDLDNAYTKVRDFVIGYVFGTVGAVIVCIAFLIAMLCGWHPFPKHITEHPRSELPRGWDGVNITTDQKTP